MNEQLKLTWLSEAIVVEFKRLCPVCCHRNWTVKTYEPFFELAIHGLYCFLHLPSVCQATVSVVDIYEVKKERFQCFNLTEKNIDNPERI